MVKKLFKHEFIYYFRSFALFLPIVLIIGIITRIANASDDGSVMHEIASASSSLMLFMSCIALLLFAFVAGVVRFYKNMYSAEGYLTLTLPVTYAQHIFVKLFTALACVIVCSVTIAATVFIAVPIDDLRELFAGFSYISDLLVGEIGTGHVIAIIIELAIAAIMYTAYSLLLAYACITVGQTAKKHRILKAIGAYYVYYLATQFVTTAINVLISNIDSTDTSDAVDVTLDSIYYAIGAHLVLWCTILFFAALCALFWFITQRIMTKKLNLE